ncbi:MAG: HAD family hydrolase [Candidatus Hydrogenedentales bacterium]
MTPQMLRAVILDLDGTLIDSTEAIVNSITHAFNEIGVAPPSRPDILRTISLPLERQLAALEPSRAAELVPLYRAHYKQYAPAQTTLMPGAQELLALCRDANAGLGFATSKSKPAAELLLDHLNVLDYFAARIGPEDVPNPKPAADALLLAAEHLRVAPSETVYIGDAPLDAEAARAARMPCILVSTGYVDAATLKQEPFPVYNGLFDAAGWLSQRLAPTPRLPV